MNDERTDAPQENQETARAKGQRDPHPIGAAIDRLTHRARDIKFAARRFLPVAEEHRRSQYKEIVKLLQDNRGLVEDPDPPKRMAAQKTVSEAIFRYHRLHNSQVPAALETGLYLSLFAAFDAFTGDLLRGLFQQKPELFASLNRSLSFKEVLEAPTIDQLKHQVLQDEIEAFRRKSYGEQFEQLSSRFDVKLIEFRRWSEFVECAQRRNLLTHCDGVVSEQYLEKCRDAGYDKTKLPALGEKVVLGPQYFFAACELVLEVGLKLGQTLWRKALPAELELADSHLTDALYEALESKIWPRAQVIGEFAFGLRRLSTDRHRKIIIVNYAQALKRTGSADQAKKILSDVDWTATSNDFKLAHAVLVEDWDAAGNLMRAVGPKGQMLSETSYHIWPLFIEFRETEAFAKAYAEVFGHPYAQKLQEDADQASARAGEEAKGQGVAPEGEAGQRDPSKPALASGDPTIGAAFETPPSSNDSPTSPTSSRGA